MRNARHHLSALAAAMAAFFLLAPLARAQSASSETWSVTIVLPSRLAARPPPTVAVVRADKRLASGVSVEIGKDTRVVTDETGRATFIAPREGDYLLARSSAH